MAAILFQGGDGLTHNAAIVFKSDILSNVPHSVANRLFESFQEYRQTSNISWLHQSHHCAVATLVNVNSLRPSDAYMRL